MPTISDALTGEQAEIDLVQARSKKHILHLWHHRVFNFMVGRSNTAGPGTTQIVN